MNQSLQLPKKLFENNIGLKSKNRQTFTGAAGLADCFILNMLWQYNNGWKWELQALFTEPAEYFVNLVG